MATRKSGARSRDLYNDADGEQTEGVSTPRNEPMGDVIAGRRDVSDTERPRAAAEHRPQPRRHKGTATQKQNTLGRKQPK